ncbi:MAG TPA: SGNH/GDSL hydrolase family protein [Solirubrobacteraceae bacterium]
MSAMNGDASPIRGRGRLIGSCVAVALALTGLVLAPAAANATENPTATTYLSLGDSISFGYQQEKFNVNYPNESPSYFEGGVANSFAKYLGGKEEVGKGLVIVNSACPGETSNGLIGENPAIGGKESTEPRPSKNEGSYHACDYHQLSGLPLHNSLAGTSQLEDTLSILKEGAPAHPVKAITLNIGSNDELAAIAKCEKEVTEEFTNEGKSKYGATPEGAVQQCIGFTAINVTFPHILKNIGDILGVIDSKEPGGGHYTGPIILMGFYNPDAILLPGSDALQNGFNNAIEEKILPNFPNVTFANPFPTFNKGSKLSQEQVSICKYTEMCNPNVQTGPGKNPESPAFGKDGDIHPSNVGYATLGKLVNEAYLANPAK